MLHEQLTLDDSLSRYAALGWRIVPNHTVQVGRCTCRYGQACPHPAKHPRLRAWPQAATADPATIREWRERWPGFNPDPPDRPRRSARWSFYPPRPYDWRWQCCTS